MNQPTTGRRLEDFRAALRSAGYLAEEGLATTIYLAYALQKPLFLEGEPGVGKTEVAKVLCQLLDAELIRVQCYRGLDANMVLFEWNYLKQIMSIRISEMELRTQRESVPDALDPIDKEQLMDEIFSEKFLVERPLLKALRSERPPVLLIDEIDRSDEEFEAFLLEFLSDFQISVPEIGTIKARTRPYVIITSNRTREVHDALRRRCLYYWIDYPTFEKELGIIQVKMPDASTKLAEQVCAFVQTVRKEDFTKKPGLAETLDWVAVLLQLDAEQLDEETVRRTLGAIFKTSEDVEEASGKLPRLLRDARTFLQFRNAGRSE